jgi:glutaminase
VSSGSLPSAERVQQALQEAYLRFRSEGDGAVSDVYPLLSQADPAAFGLCVTSVDGGVYQAGQAVSPFPIMSVSKPFVFALVCEQVGLEQLRAMVGVNATGMPFNSVQAVERAQSGRTNPMVNSGAITTTSLFEGTSVNQRCDRMLEGLSLFAGRHLTMDEETLESARGSNHRNRSLANLLTSKGALAGDPMEAVDLYTRQSCVSVTAHDLAVMGATLADGGVNPVTGQSVVDPETAHATLAVMTIAGMYETSGDWLLDVGMPAKSGIGGGIVCVSPGKGALGSFSPLLDEAGNSVRGQLAAKDLARRLGLDVLTSEPIPTPRTS